LDAPGALDSVPFAGGKIKVLEINIGKNCPLVNTELSKLTNRYPDLRANILGVIRGEKFVILKKKDKMLINDKAFVVVNTPQTNRTLSAWGHDEQIAKKILIIGGGNIGFNLAKNLEETLEGARIKIIEKDKIIDVGPNVYKKDKPKSYTNVHDCKNLFISPGLLDMRVSLGEPGSEHKETIKRLGKF